MKAVVLIPDGVGIRNFLLGPFLRQLGDEGEAVVLRAIPEELQATYQAGSNNTTQWDALIPYRESPLSFTLRNALGYAHMYWANTRSMALRFKRNKPVNGSWGRRAGFRAARLIGRLAAHPRGVKALDGWHRREVGRLPEVAHYRQLFEQLKPSVLFCSHQRPPSILPPVLAAHSLGIPTATFIFSWDNLSSKGRIAAPFDHYLVWSEHMRGELLHYYPDVTPAQVHVVGTPQFDPYVDDSLLWSRAEFFARIGADLGRPLVCYSGGDVGNYPPEPHFVKILMELIRGGQIAGNPQVLLRPAPVDNGERYNDLRREYPELIYAQPQWLRPASDKWSQVLPTAEDVRFLANLTYHADLNINLASTMTLDFALRGKPVVNVAFDVGVPPQSMGAPIWDYAYQSEHYRPVVEMGAIRCARSPAELAAHVNAYLANPALDEENRRRLVDLEVSVAPGQSTGRIIEVLRQISNHLEAEEGKAAAAGRATVHRTSAGRPVVAAATPTTTAAAAAPPPRESVRL